MSSPSHHFDHARRLLEELEAEVDGPDSDLERGVTRHEVTADAAIVEGLLAIAEALRGTMYVADAGKV